MLWMSMSSLLNIWINYVQQTIDELVLNHIASQEKEKLKKLCSTTNWWTNFKPFSSTRKGGICYANSVANKIWLNTNSCVPIATYLDKMLDVLWPCPCILLDIKVFNKHITVNMQFEAHVQITNIKWIYNTFYFSSFWF
jgi:hypothetical protein